MEPVQNNLVESALRLLRQRQDAPSSSDIPSDERIFTRALHVESALDQIEIEPACKQDGSSWSPVYWEDVHGRIVGPGVPEFSARVGRDYWLVIQYQGLPSWIHTDRLRSKRQWETAVTPQDLTGLLMTSSPPSIAQRPSPSKVATNPQLFHEK